MLDNKVQVYISSRSSTSAILCSIVRSAEEQSYEVQTPTGLSRHNRSQLHEKSVDNKTSTTNIKLSAHLLESFETLIIKKRVNICTVTWRISAEAEPIKIEYCIPGIFAACIFHG